VTNGTGPATDAHNVRLLLASLTASSLFLYDFFSIHAAAVIWTHIEISLWQACAIEALFGAQGRSE